ncbi:hypothetical protein VPHD81_0095 [Vibrio phage D81]
MSDVALVKVVAERSVQRRLLSKSLICIFLVRWRK